MNFSKSNTFSNAVVASKIMGPNPLKLCEELLRDANIPAGSTVCDLGSGSGITSVMLAREYGLDTYAVDLWSDPDENREFFRQMGVADETIHPVKADASKGLPFPAGFFDCVVSVDSYNYYGRDPEYLGAKLLPYVRRGGMLYLAIPGMVHDCHDNLPECLLAPWTPEQLEYMHDMEWWRQIIGLTSGAEIVDMRQMEGTAEAWDDWLACDNEYAAGDRASIEAGALSHLNTIAITLQRK